MRPPDNFSLYDPDVKMQKIMQSDCLHEVNENLYRELETIIYLVFIWRKGRWGDQESGTIKGAPTT